MKELVFGKKPTFAELWDACVYGLLYNPANKYVSELEEEFHKRGVTKKSHLIDVSAGTGFPALELSGEGYSIDCMDAMQDEIDVFSSKAKAQGLKINCTELTWLQIPSFYKSNSYDFVMCRGNSFIYAGGGWNEFHNVDTSKSMEAYEKTLRVFYDLLVPGGYLYIDKFKDSEVPSKQTVGNAIIAGKRFELIFYTEVMLKEHKRQASMLLKDEKGKETGAPNITYLLTMPELRGLLKKVGFSHVEELHLKSETHFDVLLAKK